MCPVAETAGLDQWVLVVDDSADCADSTVELLRAYGYDARAAYTGAEGLELARRLRPAVILLDIGLPDMTGVDFLVRLRASAATSAIPVIAITGWAGGQKQAEAERYGVADYLLKPVAPHEVFEAVRRHAPPRSFNDSTW